MIIELSKAEVKASFEAEFGTPMQIVEHLEEEVIERSEYF